MTLSTTTNRAGPYLTNGSTTVFPFTFPINAEEDIKVYKRDLSTGEQTLLVLGSHYSVSASPWTSGGSITLLQTINAGYSLTLLRVVTPTQSTDLINQGGWYPEVHETTFDRNVMISQQLQEQLDRAILQEITGSASATDELYPSAHFEVDTFTGGVDFTAGSSTQLTLSGSPAYQSNVIVTFDGVVQHHGTYGVAGATLTFLSAIPAGVVEVQVRRLSTIAVAVPAETSVDDASYVLAQQIFGG